MLAMRYLTNAFGNIIDVVVIAALEGVFSSQVMCLHISTQHQTHTPGLKGLIVFHFLQAYEFFLFAGVMVLDMILLGWMAMGYKYVDYTTGEGVVKDDEQRSNTEALYHE